ncbi:4874_t:CDS:2 [Acaulospora morrowiae]|uniref:Phosphotransferase n=1 Tax=Acaulospora morrowiae TaxID=94023 RepID=A0A9N9CNY3_9GLOM|nr:4874_t:CDS:2 [Acaulospora morrowiae]
MDGPIPTLSELEQQATIEGSKLQEIIDGFLESYQYGLTQDLSTMIPSYVSRLPTGKETGTYFALDLGGTNLRVAAVTLLGDGKTEVEQKTYVIPTELKVGPVENLFDWVGLGVKELHDTIFSKGIDTSKNEMSMGVTFSFPIKQTAINRGVVMKMGKSFDITGLEDRDVVELLQEACKRKDIDVRITAIVNDCVGVLVAGAYKDQNTIMSAVIGTGTNAACICQTSAIKKTEIPNNSAEYMIINTEWSIMGTTFLPFTRYDKLLDEQSSIPGFQPFEKMSSGMYLGELVRLVIVDYVKNFNLFGGELPGGMEIQYSIKAIQMSEIESDRTPEFTGILKLLTKNFNFDKIPSIEDMNILKEIVKIFTRRSSQLLAAAVASLIKFHCPEFPSVEREIRTAMDGSVYNHFHKYSFWMNKALRDIQQNKEIKKIKLVGIPDGGCIGAAITAMLYSH